MATFTISVRDVTVDVEKDTPLLWVVRDELRLTGSKFGCGACTMIVYGMPRRTCITPVGTVDGSSIETIEGLEGPEAEAITAAWEGLDVPQCGGCQSGQIISATALLREVPTPTDKDLDAAMAGNVCRCATYVRIRQAIHDASSSMEGGAMTVQNRRQFLATGAGLVIALALPMRGRAQSGTAAVLTKDGLPAGTFAPNAFVRIAPTTP
ncbi:isoquinoline 1-oxidoreductase, alpha subunit [Puniceibacterium sediminis]|uniref:Isoquinoline 1-oxidoreductase, alpha subunit n=1 Tax=Puniceibacterium sediminis TaxID=1608407 RepID=A0A238VSV7_9RHOB|nr:isoquinoline 1-oxidoreductase, alpha subunit [Puniceibacterium sediminis]